MKSLSLQSPAKLNLFLKVLNKRRDGYHSLVTLFERIDLCDDIRLTETKTGRIRIFCQDRDVPKGAKNIAFQAAKLLQEDFSVKQGVDIRIKKRIPVAAGLAGGSSNAATVLMGLNKLWGLALSNKKLAEYGRRLGSDVVFFIYDTSWAVGRQRGDAIKKLFFKRKLWHVLVVPRLKVYSREVFRAFDSLPRRVLTNLLTKGNDDVNILIHALRENDLLKAGRLLFNDLEAVVFKRHPHLLKIKDKLILYKAQGASLSGSGPAVFGLMSSKKEAQRLKGIMSRYYKRVFILATQMTSVLMDVRP